jgi:predicted nucleic acid-binding protein
MIVGADTGFFIAMSESKSRALQIWNDVEKGDSSLVVSVLSIAEYYTYNIPRATLPKAEELVRRMQESPNIIIVPVSLEIASHAARYRNSLNLATVDSIILATFLESQCDLVLTTDTDIAREQVRMLVQVELLE